MPETPLVVKFNQFPLNLTEPMKLFERSKSNVFYRDDESHVIIGFWEVEHGEEWVPGSFEGHGFPAVDELLVVLEGKLFAELDDGQPEQVAGHGDAILMLRDRNTHIRVEDRTRALFIVFESDIATLVPLMRGVE
jgi:ethanolamine utilization protein EutQ (cupin superfamily)